ncbi:MAG: tetratricopeptide repeat protein [Bryobacterales bacterium]|nr:tetratricopeptide repeat protein [Bryobacterales bacterium]
MRNAYEPYSVAVAALEGTYYGVRTEARGTVSRFTMPPAGYAMVEVRFTSGHVLSRTVRMEGVASDGRIRVVLSREDAIFAHDLNKAVRSISAKQLAVETQLARMVARFEAEMEAGHLDAAEERLWELTELYPEGALAWNNLGAIELARGNREHAADYFRRALQADSGCFESNLNFSRVNMLQGRLETALKYAREAGKVRRGHPSALAQESSVLLLMERYVEARSVLEELLRVDPYHGSFPELGLAVVLEELGERTEAAQHVMAWTERHPQHPETQTLRGRARQALKEAQVVARGTAQNR